MFAVGVVTLGMATAYERNYFEYRDDSIKSGSLLYTVSIFALLLLLTTGLLIYIWRGSLSNLILNQTSYGMLLVFVFAGLGMQNISQYYLTFLKNSRCAFSFAKITILQSVINFIFVILFLVYLDYGVIGLAYALFISHLSIFVITTFIQLKKYMVSFSRLMLTDALKISIPLTPRILFGVLNTQFDKMMLGMLSNTGGVGIYGIGQNISYFVFRFMTALDHVFIPEIYHRLFSQGENSSIENIGKYLTPFFYVSILAAMGVALFSEELFIILLPEAYHDGINIVIILTVFYASMFLGKITGTQLIYAKKTHVTSLLTLISILINVMLNIPMILMWGTIGAALATMIAGLISVTISYKVAQRYVSIKLEWKKMYKITSVFIIAVLWVLLMRLFAIDEYWVRLSGKVIIITFFIIIGISYKLISIETIRKTIYSVRSNG